MPGSIFEPVKIKWDGELFEIPANRVMGLIEQIEDHITFNDLIGTKNPRLARISVAYAHALRYAGADVTDEQVYKEMFKGANSGQIQNAVAGLLMIMVPPEHIQKKKGDGKGIQTLPTPSKRRTRAN